MALKLYIYFALLVSPFAVWAGEPDFTCDDLLAQEISDSDLSRMRDQFDRISHGVDLAKNKDNIPQILADELKAFKTPSKLMTILKKLAQQNVNLNFTIWWAFQNHIFLKPEHASRDIVLNTGYPAMKKYEELFSNGFDFQALYKDAHRGQIQSKRNLALYLRRLSLVASHFFDQPVDLLTESGWLTLLGADNASSVGDQLQAARVKDRQLSLKISQYLVDLNTVEGVSRHYQTYFFEDGRRRMAKDAEPLIDKLNFSEIKSLIAELELSVEKQNGFFAQIDLLIGESMANPRTTRALAVLIFYKAFLERFESVPMLTDQPVGERVVTARQFLQVKQRTHQYHLMSAFLEAQFEEYALKSEQVNQRIRSLKQRFTDLRSNLQLPKAQAETITASLDEIREVHELDLDLDATKHSISRLELQVDELVESVVSQMEKERLKSLSDLNFRGHRLIADKPYALSGVDYDQVVFTEDVVQFLKSQPSEGARFLGALTKGYVAVKKSSGLRRLPNIHPDFRDIKVINSNYGKVRLVGKRVGSTIYFFYVYQSEKPYDSKQIRIKVENFQP